MSPASQGPLEVERYIGSCLISSNVRVSGGNSTGGGKGAGNSNSNHYHHQKAKKPVSEGDRYRPGYGGGVAPVCECSGGVGARYGRSWAGMPLISMAGSGARRSRKPPPRDGKGETAEGQARTPLSRLAIHTQGAPLILAGRYCGTRKAAPATGGGGPAAARTPVPRSFRGGELPARRTNPVPTGGSASTTPSSDCLSVASDESSGHSENSLPRIIKPRKRRKKDRKPPAPAPVSAETKTCESSSIVTLKPYVPLCYDRYERRRPWDAEARVEDEERASQSSDEDLHGPQLHHELEDLEEEAPQGAPASLCQCRYCDPAGLIWDVRQHCYSPFLTPPGPFASIPLFLSPPTESEFSHRMFTSDDDRTSLRRSWSEPSAWSGTSRHPSTSLEASSAFATPSSGSSQSLEVSTEIVTSPNGHRDIEIKFYSSSPQATQDNASESVRAWSSHVWEDTDAIWGRGDLCTKTQVEE